MATIRGGERLEARLREIAEKVGKPATLRVGFLEGARYPDGKPVAMIAAIHNYGKWPFFSNMVAEKSPTWGDAIGANLVANNYDVEKTLLLAGEGIEGQLKQAIVDTMAPPLSPATIKRKGFDKPLIDTSHMLKSTGHEVKS